MASKIIWKATYLPVSDTLNLCLSKERLEYFVVISSWIGRLVRGEAVRRKNMWLHIIIKMKWLQASL